MSTLHTRGTASRSEWSESRLVHFANETGPTTPEALAAPINIPPKFKNPIDDMARSGVTPDKMNAFKSVMDSWQNAIGQEEKPKFPDATAVAKMKADTVAWAGRVLNGKVRMSLDDPSKQEAKLTFEILSNAPATNAEAAQRAAGLQERAGRNIEQGRGALFADLDAQEQRIQQQLDASPQQESFRLITRPGEDMSQPGRIPNGPDMVREGGETGLAQDQQHKRELEKYATAQTTNADWGELPSYGKTDGKDVYMYRMVSGKLEAYTPRMGLQVLDAVSGRWAFVKGVNPDGSYKIGPRPGLQNLNDVYGQRMTAINQNPGARRQYDNNNTLEEGLLKPAMNGQNRMMYAQFLQQNPDIWTGPNGGVKNRFDLLNSLGSALGAPGGRLNIPRFGPSQNPNEAQSNGSMLLQAIMALVALMKGVSEGSRGTAPSGRESPEKEAEAPKDMPEKFKTHIDALKAGITKEKLDAYVKEMNDWDESFVDGEKFKSKEDVAKMKADTVDYSNKVFKDKVKFSLDDSKSANSKMTYEMLKASEVSGEKPKEETPAATERFKEVEERQVIAVLDKLSLDGNLVPFLTFEFKEGKLVAKNSKGKEAITATFTAGGELKEADITDADDLEVAKKESENLEEKTEEAFDELDIPEDLRSRIITEWKEPKLSLKDTEGKSLGWVEFDGSTAKTTHKEPANVAALQERIEAEKTKRPKELLRSLDKALDTSASLDGDGETVDSMAGRLIEALKGNKAEGKLYLKDGDLTDNDGNEVKANFQTLLESGDYEEALQALIDVDTGSKDYRESVLKARHEVEMKKKTSIAVKDRWIDGSAVYLGQNGWEYKIGREGKMYARETDATPLYRVYDEKERDWMTLEKPVL